MVSINDLYSDLITLINQKFYTKTEYDEKYVVHDITTSFKNYCINTLNYTSTNINTYGYTETLNDLKNTISLFLKSEGNTTVPIVENTRFNFESTFADDKSFYCIIYDVVSSTNFKICIICNPEYYKLLLEDMMQ